MYHELRLNLNNAHDKLVTYKKQDDRDKFDDLMEILLPEVRDYVETWLIAAEAEGHIEKGKYSVDEFMGELYIATYDHIEDIKEDHRLYVWMLAKAQEIMEDKITDDDFNATFFPSLEPYEETETKSMEENLWSNAAGEVVLEDSFNTDNEEDYLYKIENILSNDDDQDIINKVNSKLTAESISNGIKQVIETFSLNEKMIINLSAKHNLTTIEIAQIMKTKPDTVTAVLQQFKIKLVNYSFEN